MKDTLGKKNKQEWFVSIYWIKSSRMILFRAHVLKMVDISSSSHPSCHPQSLACLCDFYSRRYAVWDQRVCLFCPLLRPQCLAWHLVPVSAQRVYFKYVTDCHSVSLHLCQSLHTQVRTITLGGNYYHPSFNRCLKGRPGEGNWLSRNINMWGLLASSSFFSCLTSFAGLTL